MIERPRNSVFGPNERGYFADFFWGTPPPFTGKIRQIAFERLPWISPTKEFVHKDGGDRAVKNAAQNE